MKILNRIQEFNQNEKKYRCWSFFLFSEYLGIVGDPVANNHTHHVPIQKWYQMKSLDISASKEILAGSPKCYDGNRCVGPHEQYQFSDIVAETFPLGGRGAQRQKNNRRKSNFKSAFLFLISLSRNFLKVDTKVENFTLNNFGLIIRKCKSPMVGGHEQI